VDFVNQLHYGDNLVRLRGDGVDKAIPGEIADLIYFDPPFKSARNYNLLFKQHNVQESPARIIMGFEDTWDFRHTVSGDRLHGSARHQEDPRYQILTTKRIHERGESPVLGRAGESAQRRWSGSLSILDR
jgi:hypothetical protein